MWQSQDTQDNDSRWAPKEVQSDFLLLLTDGCLTWTNDLNNLKISKQHVAVLTELQEQLSDNLKMAVQEAVVDYFNVLCLQTSDYQYHIFYAP
jgi:hypothetical protein